MEQAVCFATPSLNHSVSMEFMRSSMQTDWLLASKGYRRSYLNHCGDQFIAKVRNKLMHDFVVNHPYCDNLFFLDDDLGWPPEKVLEFLERDEDILVGAYPKKSDNPDGPIVLSGDDGKLIEKDGLVRCERGPTGFMRIKRHVIEEMQKHAPWFKDQDKEGKTVETPAWFAAGVAPDGWFWTEDYIFCQNAVACGFEIWADPNIEFEHRGNKVWKGALQSAIPTFRERAVKAKEDREHYEREIESLGEARLTKVGDDDVIEGQIVRSDAA